MLYGVLLVYIYNILLNVFVFSSVLVCVFGRLGFKHDNVDSGCTREGAVIIGEQTAMSNLFSCLWFNEVNTFTPRDLLTSPILS